MTGRILFVDDEPHLLENCQGLLERDFEVETTQKPEEALRRIRDEGPYAVIVSDLRMPGMNGIELLSGVRSASPDTVRIMITGCADLESAMKAVNEGSVFRFLTKPVELEDLRRTVQASLDQYSLIRAEHELLENTLVGSIRMLIEILSLVNPGAFGRSGRIRRFVRHMARRLGLQPAWQYELGGMLSQIGFVAVSQEILEKKWAGQRLTEQEEQLLSSHASVGGALLANIPRMEKIARMIALQGTGPGGGPPDEADQDETIRTGGRLLRTAMGLDQHIAQGMSRKDALVRMRLRPDLYPAEMIQAMDDLELEPASAVRRSVRIRELDSFMVLDEDVYAGNGLLLATKGLEVTVPVILRLRGFASSLGVKEPLRVTIPGDIWPKKAA